MLASVGKLFLVILCLKVNGQGIITNLSDMYFQLFIPTCIPSYSYYFNPLSGTYYCCLICNDCQGNNCNNKFPSLQECIDTTYSETKYLQFNSSHACQRLLGASVKNSLTNFSFAPYMSIPIKSNLNLVGVGPKFPFIRKRKKGPIIVVHSPEAFPFLIFLLLLLLLLLL